MVFGAEIGFLLISRSYSLTLWIYIGCLGKVVMHTRISELQLGSALFMGEYIIRYDNSKFLSQPTNLSKLQDHGMGFHCASKFETQEVIFIQK
jgi:hypothetical protein